jgi:hypothetical protein
VRLLTGKALDATVLLAATVTIALDEKETPASLAKHFDKNSWQLIVIIAVAAIIGTIGPFSRFANRNGIDRRLILNRNILASLGELVEIANNVNPTLGMSDPGLHFWRPRRTFRHPISRELQRIGFFRLGNTPVTRSFSPLPGVGVVGLCWRDNQPHSVDVEALATLLTTQSTFDARRATDKDSVMNLSWAEFSRVKHRGAVFATPVRGRRGKFIGCISIDTTAGYAGLSTHIPALAANLAANVGASELELLSS